MRPTLRVFRQPTEARKIRKPLMEKKRRARINDCLDELKRIILDENNEVVRNIRPSKLEKADILERTVKMVKSLIELRYDNYLKDFKERFEKVISGYENMTSVEKRRLTEYLFSHPEINEFRYKFKTEVQNDVLYKEEIWRPWN